jgi:hypothetical protein
MSASPAIEYPARATPTHMLIAAAINQIGMRYLATSVVAAAPPIQRPARTHRPSSTRPPAMTIHVFDIPSEIVVIVPQYRGFKYIVVRDELIILDPDTLEIVAVISA